MQSLANIFLPTLQPMIIKIGEGLRRSSSFAWNHLLRVEEVSLTKAASWNFASLYSLQKRQPIFTSALQLFLISLGMLVAYLKQSKIQFTGGN